MIAQCFIGKKRRMGAAACYLHRRHTAMLATAFAAVTLGVANQALAHRFPAACSANGPASSISVLIEAAAIDLKHGDQICIAVQILNTCAGCCDVTGLTTELVMPDASIVSISVGASLPSGTSFSCPSADVRCATASNCTLSGGEKGYRYFIAHANEHGPLPSGCPPIPPAGSGEVSAFLRSTAGFVHTGVLNGSANICQTARVPIAHACCELCAGTCTNEFGEGDGEGLCPFPSVFTPDKSCAEVTCTPKVCLGPVPPCEAGQTCNPATGTCVNLTDPPLSTPCVSDNNVCTTDHCDGLGKCVLFFTACDTPDFCNDGLNCTIDTCNANNPPSCCDYSPLCPGRVCCADGQSCDDNDKCTDDFCGPDGCCAHTPHVCPERACFRITGCDPNDGCQYESICSFFPDFCEDHNVCTEDICDDTEDGCCRFVEIPCPPIPCKRNVGCDPSDGCLYVDDCRTGALADCCPDDGNPCTEEFCDQVTGLCGSTPDCTVPDDCDDELNCTVETCVNSCCGHEPLCDECFKGEACSDSEPCARPDGCQGVCHHTTAGPTRCFFGEYGCDQFQPCETNSDCPPGTACAFSCCAPSCVPLCGNDFQAAAVAPDPSGGTSSSGDAAGETAGAGVLTICCADGASCDDNDKCTDDECDGGCCAYSPHFCPPLPCKRNVGCDPVDGCQYVFDCRTDTVAGGDGDPAALLPFCCPDDGNPCTREVCNADGTCGTIPACEFPADCEETPPVLCTVETCIDSCCGHLPLCPGGVCCADGASCDDGDKCTDDACVGGCCAHTPHFCPPIPCKRNTGCNPVAGCQYTPDCRTDGVAGENGIPVGCCPDDGNLCTHEFCDQATGTCGLTKDCTTPADCEETPPVLCTVETCTNSCCGHNPLCPAGSVCCADGASCDDGDACTDDACTGGCCTHTPHVCPELPCQTLVRCDPSTGCVYEPVVCDDLDECTDDRCDTGLNRCVFVDNGTCRQATCRTPGFWGTHGNNAKRNSKNITQAVINACGGSLSVCGECINSTVPVNNAASATEAMCVAPKGAIVLQNARQLTALALNCCISGFGDDCGCDAGLSELFSDCNNACQGFLSTRTNAQCRNEIDCFNNGGQYDRFTGTCGDGGPDNCHTRKLVNADLGLDFSTPGPAGGSDDCHAANGNHCAILALPNCSLKNGAGAACCGKDSCPVLPTLVDECDKDAPCSGAEICETGSGCDGACFFTAAGNTRCFAGESGCGVLPPCVTDCDCAAGSACSDTCCGLKCIPLCGNPFPAAAAGGAGTSTSK